MLINIWPFEDLAQCINTPMSQGSQRLSRPEISQSFYFRRPLSLNFSSKEVLGFTRPPSHTTSNSKTCRGLSVARASTGAGPAYRQYGVDNTSPVGPLQFYATCHPGLESVVARELGSSNIGAFNIQEGKSGVSFR